VSGRQIWFLSVLAALLLTGFLIAPAVNPAATAATQTGGTATASTHTVAPTIVPARNPHSALCQKMRAENRIFLTQESNYGKLVGGHWAAYQKFLTSFDETLSSYSQVVLGVGRNVPGMVRGSAHHELANVKVGQRRVMKAKNLAELNAAAGALALKFIAAQGPIEGYVEVQCGLAQAFGLTISGSVPGSRRYQTVPDNVSMTSQG
jgi:hypothetical protein